MLLCSWLLLGLDDAKVVNTNVAAAAIWSLYVLPNVLGDGHEVGLLLMPTLLQARSPRAPAARH